LLTWQAKPCRCGAYGLLPTYVGETLCLCRQRQTLASPFPLARSVGEGDRR